MIQARTEIATRDPRFVSNPAFLDITININPMRSVVTTAIELTNA